MQANRFIILIHPNGYNPSELLAKLNAKGFVPMQVLPYEAWLGIPHDDSYGLLFVTGEGGWKYMHGAEKFSIWNEVESILGRSIPRTQTGFYI